MIEIPLFTLEIYRETSFTISSFEFRSLDNKSPGSLLFLQNKILHLLFVFISFYKTIFNVFTVLNKEKAV